MGANLSVDAIADKNAGGTQVRYLTASPYKLSKLLIWSFLVGLEGRSEFGEGLWGTTNGGAVFACVSINYYCLVI
jgi:hypothetical protein